MNEHINPPEVSTPAGYSHVVVAQQPRKVIFLSGQVPLNGAGELVGKGDLRAQARQVFQNLEAGLTAAGATFADVTKISTFVVNYKPADRDIIRELRSEFLAAEALPASTLLGVQALANPDFLIEIEAYAAVG